MPRGDGRLRFCSRNTRLGARAASERKLFLLQHRPRQSLSFSAQPCPGALVTSHPHRHNPASRWFSVKEILLVCLLSSFSPTLRPHISLLLYALPMSIARAIIRTPKRSSSTSLFHRALSILSTPTAIPAQPPRALGRQLIIYPSRPPHNLPCAWICAPLFSFSSPCSKGRSPSRTRPLQPTGVGAVGESLLERSRSRTIPPVPESRRMRSPFPAGPDLKLVFRSRRIPQVSRYV